MFKKNGRFFKAHFTVSALSFLYSFFAWDSFVNSGFKEGNLGGFCLNGYGVGQYYISFLSRLMFFIFSSQKKNNETKNERSY